MDLWTALLDVLILLTAALLLGGLFERLKQSAMLGYLLAGTLLGPNALDLMPNHRAVTTIAELGVALLLFTIGLEFSWRRLRSIGRIALLGGSLQVIVTVSVATAVGLWLGLAGPPALAIGAAVAVSSTAFVLRLLAGRKELDSVPGRNALGILLLQDIAVVPLLLMVTALASSEQGSSIQVVVALGRSIGVAAVLITGLFVVLNYVLPLLLTELGGRDRDLTVLVAIVTALGAAWMSGRLGLSPVLGAFVAGMMLAESPFATQVHSDVSSLRSLFVTLFFGAIGMLCDPVWVLHHWPSVLALVGAIVLGKTIVITAIAWLLRSSPGHAIATGICLAQAGEFSFVLAEVARRGGVLDEGLFELIISATIGTLFLTPFLVAAAPSLAGVVGKRTMPLRSPDQRVDDLKDHVVIVGFGPAGQSVAEALMGRHQASLVVVELHARNANVARTYGLRTFIGDAARGEVLEHLRIGAARAIVITVPDPATVRHIVAQVRLRGPQATIVARARYHVHRAELLFAGAAVVVDEEEQVGRRMAAAARRVLRDA